jgi:ADP-heptose:LPS heptosyltransferase
VFFFYRNRGLGDQLINSSLSRYFTEVLGARTYQASNKLHEPVWAFNPYAGGYPSSLPLNLDTTLFKKGTRFFQGLFFMESVSEWDTEQEQPNVYDRIFAMCGINPQNVAPKWKRPFFMMQKSDVDTREQFLKQFNNNESFQNFPQNGYFFVQSRATNVGRTIPAHILEKILSAASELAEKLKIPILCSDDLLFSEEVASVVRQFPSCIDISGQINSVRLYASLIESASLVIGPDSSAIHFAAAFETPALGIWGPFSPAARTKYYPRQIHLHHTDRCQYSPCFNYLPALPVNKCPKGQEQTSCEVFEGVTYEEVFGAINELI